MMRPFALCTLALALALPACVKLDPLDPTIATLTNALTTEATDSSGTTGSTGDATSNGSGSSATLTTENPTTGVPMTSSSTDPMTSSTTDVGTGSSGGPGSSTGGGGGGGYGPCEMMDPPCPTGSDCLMIMGLEGNFCSPKCDAMTECPALDGGTAQPMCVLGMGMGDPTNCGLICDPMGNDCPMGSTCKPIQGVGICTYP